VWSGTLFCRQRRRHLPCNHRRPARRCRHVRNSAIVSRAKPPLPNAHGSCPRYGVVRPRRSAYFALLFHHPLPPPLTRRRHACSGSVARANPHRLVDRRSRTLAMTSPPDLLASEQAAPASLAGPPLRPGPGAPRKPSSTTNRFVPPSSKGYYSLPPITPSSTPTRDGPSTGILYVARKNPRSANTRLLNSIRPFRVVVSLKRPLRDGRPHRVRVHAIDFLVCPRDAHSHPATSQSSYQILNRYHGSSFPFGANPICAGHRAHVLTDHPHPPPRRRLQLGRPVSACSRSSSVFYKQPAGGSIFILSVLPAGRSQPYHS